MAFSPSVPEHTPSTAITNDGKVWIDCSARSIQPDDKHDGGDALELEVRRNRESTVAKRATLSAVVGTPVREARTTLEHAARTGEDLPTWMAQTMRAAAGSTTALSVQNPQQLNSPTGGNWFSA
jgi:hypothetical protein